MGELTLEILKQLVSFRSITPKGEDAIIYISKILSEHGFDCDIKSFGDGYEKTTNLYAVLGNSNPNICFAGHLDVVPPGYLANWQYDPFVATEQDGYIYGRGVVDMKGAIAASIAATIEFLKLNRPFGAISFLLTTDEEGSGKNGTKLMLDYIKDKYKPIDFCIVGEPTCESKLGDVIKIGRRGSINFVLRVRGKQGHVAYPERALNPVPVMIKILSHLSELQLDKGAEYFDKSNLEVTSIDVDNKISNIIPESITANFNIRFSDLHSEESLVALIKEVIGRYSDNYELDYSCSSNPFIQPYSEEIDGFANIVSKITGVNPSISTTGGTSDARFIYKYCQLVEFGLFSDQAHKINENCKISDLQMLCKVYYAYLVASFSSK